MVKADEAVARVIGVIRPMRERGMTLQAIADELNRMGVGSNWSIMKVKRALARWRHSGRAVHVSGGNPDLRDLDCEHDVAVLPGDRRYVVPVVLTTFIGDFRAYR